eukprot:TRINITY_DN18458_c0_g1_i3.p1 TRINITY_DN18458_c0_g1~~TRINITY_DN18458_c0_g1_i3.p1  ORF type:complete len:601 (+),score=149.57 TRINITY_DN18458_c0_g1_i3:51-1805(+)
MARVAQTNSVHLPVLHWKRAYELASAEGAVTAASLRAALCRAEGEVAALLQVPDQSVERLLRGMHLAAAGDEIDWDSFKLAMLRHTADTPISASCAAERVAAAGDAERAAAAGDAEPTAAAEAECAAAGVGTGDGEGVGADTDRLSPDKLSQMSVSELQKAARALGVEGAEEAARAAIIGRICGPPRGADSEPATEPTVRQHDCSGLLRSEAEAVAETDPDGSRLSRAPGNTPSRTSVASVSEGVLDWWDADVVAGDLERHTAVVYSMWDDLRRWRAETKQQEHGEAGAVMLGLRHMRSQLAQGAALPALQERITSGLCALAARAADRLETTDASLARALRHEAATSEAQQALSCAERTAELNDSTDLENLLGGVLGRLGERPPPDPSDVPNADGDVSIPVESFLAALQRGGGADSSVSRAVELVLQQRRAMAEELETLNSRLAEVGERERATAEQQQQQLRAALARAAEAERRRQAAEADARRQGEDFQRSFEQYRENCAQMRQLGDSLARENLALRRQLRSGQVDARSPPRWAQRQADASPLHLGTPSPAAGPLSDDGASPALPSRPPHYSPPRAILHARLS